MIPIYYWLFDARRKYEKTVEYEGGELQVGDTLDAELTGEAGAMVVFDRCRYSERGSFQDVVSLKRVA